MLTLTSAHRIYAYTLPSDMRKGIDGLSGIVREAFQADPTDGSLFLFVNRRRDRLKILHFADGGWWLYYRVLEGGTFEAIKPVDNSCRIVMDATQLTMLLSGVSLAASQQRRKRYSCPPKESQPLPT